MLPTMTLSARNKLVGRIEEIQFGGVTAHVVIRVAPTSLKA
jgi:molybdopterin-binding protein